MDGEVREEGEGRGSKEEESQLDECKIVLRTEHSVLYTVHCEKCKIGQNLTLSGSSLRLMVQKGSLTDPAIFLRSTSAGIFMLTFFINLAHFLLIN